MSAYQNNTPHQVIFVDGVDGSGKTTLIKQMESEIRKAYPGREVAIFRLPENIGRANYRDIIKKGPRVTDIPRQDNLFDVEDALLNLACFASTLNAMNAVKKTHPHSVILCDRSLFSIECYQPHYKDDPVLAMGIRQMRAAFEEYISPSICFLLQPPETFIRDNLTQGRLPLDVIDQQVLSDIEGRKKLYRGVRTALETVILTNPETYLDEALSCIRL